MVPVRGIEPRVDPYHGPVLPLYYTGRIIPLYLKVSDAILSYFFKIWTKFGPFLAKNFVDYILFALIR